MDSDEFMSWPSGMIEKVVVDFSNNRVIINGVEYQVNELKLKFRNKESEVKK